MRKYALPLIQDQTCSHADAYKGNDVSLRGKTNFLFDCQCGHLLVRALQQLAHLEGALITQCEAIPANRCNGQGRACHRAGCTLVQPETYMTLRTFDSTTWWCAALQARSACAWISRVLPRPSMAMASPGHAGFARRRPHQRKGGAPTPPDALSLESRSYQSRN
jgi:hypothetical protein